MQFKVFRGLKIILSLLGTQSFNDFLRYNLQRFHQSLFDSDEVVAVDMSKKFTTKKGFKTRWVFSESFY